MGREPATDLRLETIDGAARGLGTELLRLLRLLVVNLLDMGVELEVDKELELDDMSLVTRFPCPNPPGVEILRAEVLFAKVALDDSNACTFGIGIDDIDRRLVVELAVLRLFPMVDIEGIG